MAKTFPAEDTTTTASERAQATRETLARGFAEARARTLALFDLAREEDLHESPGFGFRPVIWHLAHIGVFEGYWLLQKLGEEPAPDERYERIFDPITTPREESKHLPARKEMEEYLSRVRERALAKLSGTNFDEANPLTRDAYLFRLVLEHERQHQETLAYLLQMLAPEKKDLSAWRACDDKSDSQGAAARVSASSQSRMPSQTSETSRPRQSSEKISTGETATVAEGAFLMGSVRDEFAYDNERPAHEVSLPSFKIAKLLTTNEEYAEFVAEGGYRRREFWSEEGWGWREREGWEHPLYWIESGNVWRERRMFDETKMRPRHPVTCVSWYEAEAYARFRGMRLPSEAEWEKAASWDEESARKLRFAWGDEEPSGALCNFDFNFWDTTEVGAFPDGASPYGCMDMTGDVWEWTSEPFKGYEGFEPFPYPEYSQTWFDEDHRVLKGGSWATGSSILRTSFRNFFRRHFRIAFTGIRLAADA